VTLALVDRRRFTQRNCAYFKDVPKRLPTNPASRIEKLSRIAGAPPDLKARRPVRMRVTHGGDVAGLATIGLAGGGQDS
jgi:hypothetical protein